MKAKKIVSLALVLMLVGSIGLMGASAAQNISDTSWGFSFTSSGQTLFTENRDKYNKTDVYYNVTSFSGSNGFSYSAKVFAVSNNGTRYDNFGQSINIIGKGVKYLPNKVNPTHPRACVRGITGINGSAGGWWSPDNSSGKTTAY